MSESRDRVASYYNLDPEREWERFDRHLFEFPVTLHYLKEHLEPESRILDVGAGPGRYAIELARLGHEVTLVDLSEKLLALARQKAEEAGQTMAGFQLASATDLSNFTSDSFDAVLCMGPMYHLTHESERDQAMAECLRVLRPDGLLVVAFVSVLGRVFDLIRNYPEKLAADVDGYIEVITGPSIASDKEPRFTDAYFVQPAEVGDLMSRYPVEQLALLGVEGMTSQSDSVLSEADDHVLKAWIDFAIAIADTPAAIYGSDHILFVGRKS